MRWDFRPTLVRLDYTESGAPPDYENVDAERKDIDRIDTVLWGFDFEGDLFKANLFGGAFDESWVSLKTRYQYRNGYDPTAFFLANGRCKDATDTDCADDDASNFSATLEFKHPDFSKLSFGLAYEVGDNTENLVRQESLGVTIGATY
ncbi:MAG: hypothetical protein WBF53_05500 [Litorimonas sp.]